MTITETRVPESETPVCPFWCGGHTNFAVDNFTHMSHSGSVELSFRTLLVTVEQGPGDDIPHVVLTFSTESDFEDKLTAAEAVRLSVLLRDHAETVRANGDHLCWCDGLHQPGDDHFGEFQNVGLELNERRGDQVATMLFREWKGESTYVRLVASDERHEVNMTPDEADQLADVLQEHAATIRTAG